MSMVRNIQVTVMLGCVAACGARDLDIRVVEGESEVERLVGDELKPEVAATWAEAVHDQITAGVAPGDSWMVIERFFNERAWSLSYDEVQGKYFGLVRVGDDAIVSQQRTLRVEIRVDVFRRFVSVVVYEEFD